MSRVANSASARVKRTSISGRNILTVAGKEPGYEYRIVNDAGDRIQQFLDAGYELCNASDVQVGDKRVNASTPEGSKAQVAVGKGDKAFVMRIREEFRTEDNAAKQAHIDRLEQSIKQTASTNSDYGKVSITRGQS